MLTGIIKRDGRMEAFNQDKIVQAVFPGANREFDLYYPGRNCRSTGLVKL